MRKSNVFTPVSSRGRRGYPLVLSREYLLYRSCLDRSCRVLSRSTSCPSPVHGIPPRQDQGVIRYATGVGTSLAAKQENSLVYKCVSVAHKECIMHYYVSHILSHVQQSKEFKCVENATSTTKGSFRVTIIFYQTINIQVTTTQSKSRSAKRKGHQDVYFGILTPPDPTPITSPRLPHPDTLKSLNPPTHTPDTRYHTPHSPGKVSFTVWSLFHVCSVLVLQWGDILSLSCRGKEAPWSDLDCGGRGERGVSWPGDPTISLGLVWGRGGSTLTKWPQSTHLSLDMYQFLFFEREKFNKGNDILFKTPHCVLILIRSK